MASAQERERERKMMMMMMMKRRLDAFICGRASECVLVKEIDTLLLFHTTSRYTACVEEYGGSLVYKAAHLSRKLVSFFRSHIGLVRLWSSAWTVEMTSVVKFVFVCACVTKPSSIFKAVLAVAAAHIAVLVRRHAVAHLLHEERDGLGVFVRSCWRCCWR